jgi:hypothetical protein
MIRDFLEAVVGPLAALIIAATAPCFSFGDEPPFLFSKDHDSVFRLEAFTWSVYFHFGKDGTYRRITRHHLFVEEADRGTWKQDATGQIEVRSSIGAKTEVKSGPLRISVRDTEQLEALRPLEKDIGKFLAADKRDSYTRHEIERACKSVAIKDRVEKVTRKQLVELLDACKAYLKDDTKNRFHFVPIRYQKFVLLASSDCAPFGEYARTPDRVKQVADVFARMAQPGTPPSMVYVLVDTGPALQEMKTTQRFIFYPELNRCGNEEILRHK